MEDFLKYVSGFRDTVWMAANGEIADYITAYRGLIFSADGRKVYNPASATLWMEVLGQIHKIRGGETITIS